MNHDDHVALLRDGVAPGVWADLGSGTGAFTLALADLVGPAGEIHSVDRDGAALRQQERSMRSRFPAAGVKYLAADFTKPLDLPSLDGVVMANSLHFVRNKEEVLGHVLAMLRPQGRFILIEYDADRGNPWVPHPLSFETWRSLAARSGLIGTRLLHSVPSRFLDRIYSALSVRPAR
ncbi:MAG: class I SAM-dependent methyltransferase [Candidatus Limnocylindria bacterium]